MGLLMPLDEANPPLSYPAEESAEPAWDALTRLGEEIVGEWRSPLTSTELLAEMSRQEVSRAQDAHDRCQRLFERLQSL